MATKSNTFSWVFIVALGAAAIWAVSKLTSSTSGSGSFTGTSPQRGMAGYDQFGNPISPGSGYAGQGFLSS